MRKWLALVLTLAAGAADAQPVSGGLLGRGASYTSFVPPASATAGCVGLFLGSPLALGCDAGLSYNATTDTLTTGMLTAGNVVVTALPTPGSITVTPTLSQLGGITVVAGAALAVNDTGLAASGTAPAVDRTGVVTGARAFLSALTTHADNAAALAAGLVAGDLYKTATGVVMVAY